VRVRVGVSGVILSAPISSFFGCALEERVELGLVGRFGRTAEADIPDSSKMAGKGVLERYVPSTQSGPRLPAASLCE
jgi:hypothetical protein